MGFDLEKLKRKLSSGKAEKGPSGWLTLKVDDKRLVRMLPDEMDEPLKMFEMHYKVAKFPFVCLKMKGETCPCCEAGWHLYNEGKKNGDEAMRKMGLNLLPSKRFYSAVVERDLKEGELPVAKWWSYTSDVAKRLEKIAADEDVGDFTDAKNGTDLTLEVVKNSKGFQDTLVTPKRKASKLCEAEEECERLIQSIAPIETLLAYKTAKEIEGMVNLYLNVDGEDLSEEVEKYGKVETVAEVASVEKKGSKKQTVDDAFADLMGSDEDK